jgi:hypothetical protein
MNSFLRSQWLFIYAILYVQCSMCCQPTGKLEYQLDGIDEQVVEILFFRLYLLILNYTFGFKVSISSMLYITWESISCTSLQLLKHSTQTSISVEF